MMTQGNTEPSPAGNGWEGVTTTKGPGQRDMGQMLIELTDSSRLHDQEQRAGAGYAQSVQDIVWSVWKHTEPSRNDSAGDEGFGMRRELNAICLDELQAMYDSHVDTSRPRRSAAKVMAQQYLVNHKKFRSWLHERGVALAPGDVTAISIQLAWQDDNIRAKQSTRMKKIRASDGGTRNRKLAASIHEWWTKAKKQDPEGYAKRCQNISDGWTDDMRARLGKRSSAWMRDYYADDDNRQLQSERQLAFWEGTTPEERRDVVFARGGYQKRSELSFPTKPEAVVLEAYKDQIEYTGDRKLWIRFPSNGRRKNPDFIVRPVEPITKVIEVFGDYWHDAAEIPEMLEGYASAGVECLVVWEREIYRRWDKVSARIDQFIISNNTGGMGNPRSNGRVVGKPTGVHPVKSVNTQTDDAVGNTEPSPARKGREGVTTEARGYGSESYAGNGSLTVGNGRERARGTRKGEDIV